MMLHTTPSREGKAKLSLLSAMLIFGTLVLFVRYIPLPSSMIAFSRGFIGTLFIILFLAIKRMPISWTAIRQNIGRLILCGIFIGFNWIFLFEAYRYTSVAIATLCYYMAPIIVILVSPIVLKERLTVCKLCCVALALIGMVLVSGIGQDTGTTNVTGIFFGLGAAVMYAAIIVLNKKLSPIAAYDKTIMQLGIASLILLPYVFATEDIAAIAMPPLGWALLLVLGMVHTGFAYTLYFGSLSFLRGQTIALFSYLDPIFAIFLSAVVLHEPLTGPGLLGAVLVLGSTCFSEWINCSI